VIFSKLTLAVTGACVVMSSFAAAAEVKVGEFSQSDVRDWAEKSFRGNTRYQLAERDGRIVLVAQSSAAASGFFRKMEIDLERTPYLNWSWKIENTLQDTDERTKKGDDYPARVYVVFSFGPVFWKTRALNYVWSSNQAEGADWPNAFTASAHMIAVEAGRERTGQWRNYKRNVREDFLKYFGDEISHASAVAVMTDTDNSNQNATAYYGDIFFTSD
jgi:hypothetical protein